MIGDIDSAGKEQSAGIGEVSAAVSQMDEMTQQNAALVEEAAASSKSMEEQSQSLTRSSCISLIMEKRKKYRHLLKSRH